MSNANGQRTSLDNKAYFINLVPGDPEVRLLVERKGGHEFKTYLGASEIEDAIAIIRKHLAYVRTQVIAAPPAAIIVADNMREIEALIYARSAPEDIQKYVAGLAPYRRLTRHERAAALQEVRSGPNRLVAARMISSSASQRLDCGVLEQLVPPLPARLLDLYQDFVDCRIELRNVVELHERPVAGSPLPYREISVADFVTHRVLARSPDTAAEDEGLPDDRAEPDAAT